MGKKQTIDHTRCWYCPCLQGRICTVPDDRELARRSDHTFEMKEGTLYPVLHSLERDGLVEAYQQEAPTGRMRKYYHLTRKGGAALRSEAEAWRAYSGAVNAVLRSSPGLNLA